MSKIYYRTRKDGEVWILESGVNTNFVGIAWSFVKSDWFKANLVVFAENNGWELSK